MTSIIHKSDFLLSGWEKKNVDAAIAGFDKSFREFEKIRGNLNARYVSNLLGSFIRSEFMSRQRAKERADNPNRSSAERRRRSRKITGPADFPAYGKTVTNRIHSCCELIHWIMYDDDFKSKKKRMTQHEAVRWVSEWIYLLRLEDPGTIRDLKTSSEKAIYEDKIEGIAARLSRIYRDWHPGQLPGCSRNYSYSSNMMRPIRLKKTS